MRASTLTASLGLFAALAACDSGEAAKAPGLSEQRTMLSQGYSLLYSDASHLDWIELALYVKFDSQEFNDMVTAVSRSASAMKQDLERAGRDYPGVRINLQPLPEMETRKRAAIVKDWMIRFEPFSGHSRIEYERTLLIGLSNALNHESHLCRVMAEEEPDAGLKKLLQASEKRYGDLYVQVVSLLDREYFRSDPGAGKPREESADQSRAR